MSQTSTFTFTFSFPVPRPQPSPFHRTGTIFTLTPEPAVGSKRHAASALPRSTKRRKIGVLKQRKSKHTRSARSSSTTKPTLASALAPTVVCTPTAHATMVVRPKSAVAALLQATVGCSLMTAKATCEKGGFEDLVEYVSLLTPTPAREVLQEAEWGLQNVDVVAEGENIKEIWEIGSKSGFRWSDRELRVAILETIPEEDEEGGW